MRRLWTALALLLIPSMAMAFGNADYLPFSKTAASANNLHVAWVIDDTTAAVMGDNYDQAMIDQQNMLVGLRDQLEAAGIEIHNYTYSQFRANMRLWHDLGLPRASGGGGYALAFMPAWHNKASYRGLYGSAFFRADSCSAHIIHYGGTSNGIPGTAWVDNAGTPSNMFGAIFLAALGETSMGVTNNVMDSVLVVASAPQDSFFYQVNLLCEIVTNSNRPPGISKVVRIFRSQFQADSLMPGTNGDFTMRYAYRVYTTNQGISATANPYVDFVIGESSNHSGHELQVSFIAWALVSRWVTLPTVKMAMVWTNYGLFGANPFYISRPNNYGGSGPANLANISWPRATYIDSVFKDLRVTYHVDKMTVTTQMDSLKALIASQPSYGICKAWNWVRWSQNWGSYDSLTQARSPNGVMASSSGDTSGYQIALSRRVGHAFNPGNVTPALRFGVPQSFFYMDSVYRTIGLTGALSNFYCPVDVANNMNLMPLGVFDYPGAPGATAAAGFVCPADSFFTGLADAGRFWVAGYFGTPSGGQVNDATAPTRGYSAGRQWNLLPWEDYVLKDGRVVHLMQVGGFGLSGQGTPGTPASPAIFGDTYKILSGTATRSQALWMGLWTRRFQTNNPAVAYGQTVVPSADDAYQSWGGGVWRTRVVQLPIRGLGNVPQGWYHDYYAYQANFLKAIKACEDIAGHRLVEWVYPEDLTSNSP